MSQDNNDPFDAPLDFSKFLESTLKHEQAKKAIVVSGEGEKTPNQEYRERYSNHAVDRFWMGPRRY